MNISTRQGKKWN